MKVCCVCQSENSSYRCPTCRLPYCSTVCCKTHKECNCSPSDVELSDNGDSKKMTKTYEFPTEDTVQPDKLELLRHSDAVQNCLNNPHVRDIIKAIFKDEDPTRAIGLAMTEPIFVELADACLKTVEPPDEDKPC